MRQWSIFFLVLWVGSAQAQTAINWSRLSEVRFLQKMERHTGYLSQHPRFSRSIKALEGKEIEISGYILPLDVSGKVYALSRYPYSACFFCGGAGLESVMDIWFAKPVQRYQLDQYVKLRGILRLSDSGEGLLYLLEDAVEVK